MGKPDIRGQTHITSNAKVWIGLGVAAVLVSYFIYVHFIVPAPFFASWDPELQYMESSLAIFKGQSYVYIDHPGTPVELIGSGIFALTYPFVALTHQPFFLFQLQHPELFLVLSRGLLALTSVLCVFLLLRYAVPGNSRLATIASLGVAVAFYALYPLTFTSIAHWSHTDFIFPFGTSLLVVTFLLFQRAESWTSLRVFFLGFALGALIACQIYFATWLIGAVSGVVALGALRRIPWRRVRGFVLNLVVSTIVGFFVLTLPILRSYPQFVAWIINLTFHQGKYGAGEYGVISAQSFTQNLVYLVQTAPFLFVVIAGILLALGLLAVNRRHRLREQAELWAAGCGFSIQLLVTLFLIIKQPGAGYLFAIAAIMPLLLAILFRLLGDSTKPARWVRIIATTVLLVAFLLNFGSAVQAHDVRVATIANENARVQQFLAKYASSNGKRPDQLRLLWTYPWDSACFGLWLGNEFANAALTPEISDVCKNQWLLDVFLGGAIATTEGFQYPDNFSWDVIITSQASIDSYPLLAKLANAGSVIPDNDGIVFIVSRTNKQTF